MKRWQVGAILILLLAAGLRLSGVAGQPAGIGTG